MDNSFGDFLLGVLAVIALIGLGAYLGGAIEYNRNKNHLIELGVLEYVMVDSSSNDTELRFTNNFEQLEQFKGKPFKEFLNK